MKCRACWAEKAYVRNVGGWKGQLMSCLLLVPLKCHHCYHKFNVLWFFTIGKRLTPPPIRGEGVSTTATHTIPMHSQGSPAGHKGAAPNQLRRAA